MPFALCLACAHPFGADTAATQNINIINYKYPEFGKLKNLKNENFERHRNNDDNGIYNMLKLSPNNSHTMEILIFFY